VQKKSIPEKKKGKNEETGMIRLEGGRRGRKKNGREREREGDWTSGAAERRPQRVRLCRNGNFEEKGASSKLSTIRWCRKTVGEEAGRAWGSLGRVCRPTSFERESKTRARGRGEGTGTSPNGKGENKKVIACRGSRRSQRPQPQCGGNSQQNQGS